jgi:hypothetical protein
MPILRSLVKQTPAIAISAAVLVLAAGTGVSFATTSADSASGTSAGHDAAGALTWHRLHDGAGWRGTIKYAVSNGVVYLSGIERDRCAGKTCAPLSPAMTKLPPGARPASPQLVVPVAMDTGAGTVSILRNGQIIAPGRPFNFVSLSGVSFGLGS